MGIGENGGSLAIKESKWQFIQDLCPEQWLIPFSRENHQIIMGSRWSGSHYVNCLLFIMLFECKHVPWVTADYSELRWDVNTEFLQTGTFGIRKLQVANVLVHNTKRTCSGLMEELAAFLSTSCSSGIPLWIISSRMMFSATTKRVLLVFGSQAFRYT